MLVVGRKGGEEAEAVVAGGTGAVGSTAVVSSVGGVESVAGVAVVGVTVRDRNGNWLSSKMTCLDVSTRRVLRSKHRYPQ